MRIAIAASALALAGGIHLAHGSVHGDVSAAAVPMFIAFGLAQVAAAVAILVRPIRTIRLGVATLGALGAVAWAASRTIGLPVVGIEQAGLLDASTAALGALAALVVTPFTAARPARHRLLPGAAVVALTAMVGTAVGAAAPAEHGHGSVAADVHLHGLDATAVDLGPDPDHRATASLDADLITVAGQPAAVELTPRAAFIAARDAGTITRIERGTRASRVFDVGGEPAVLAHAFGSLWVGRGRGDVLRLDPLTGERLARIPVSLPGGIAAGDGLLWVTEGTDGLLLAIDPGHDRIVGRIAVGFGPTGLVHTPDGLWVVNTLDREVVRVERGRVTATVEVGGGAAGIEHAFGSLWVASASDGTVGRIHPRTARVIDVITVDDVSLPGRGPIALARGGNGIWVLNNNDRTVVQIDGSSGEPGRPLLLANAVAPSIVPASIAADDAQVWATDAAGDAVGVLMVEER